MSTHRKSTLPSLLDAYLPPHHKKQCDRGQKNSQQKVGEPGKHRKLTSSNEDEEDLKVKATRKALQEQRHLELYKNMYRLLNTMRLHYMDLLSKKVQQQRLEIKERDLQFQRNIEEQEKKQNTTRRFGQRSEYSQLRHNSKYLQSIPKSHYYMIVELQDQLAKNGILKSRGDYEDFWRLLKQNTHASQFVTKLQDVKLKINRPLPHFNIRLVQDQAKSPHAARMKNNHLTTGGLPGLSNFQHINHLVSKQKKVQEETQQMFPKVVVPHSSTFQMFSTKQSNAQTVVNSRAKAGIPGIKTLNKVQESSHHREVHLNKLYQMYSRSFANMAVTQRLLERSGHFMEFEEPSVQDLMLHQETDATGKITQSQKTSYGSFLTLSDAHLCEEPNQRSLEESEKQDETSGGINVEVVSQDLKEQSQNQVAPDPVNVYVPLNIEDILPNSRIVEAKRRSSNLWINYANIGI